MSVALKSRKNDIQIRPYENLKKKHIFKKSAADQPLATPDQ